MPIKRPLLIMRVDELWPPTWYAGTSADGRPRLTHDQAEATRITNTPDAREAVAWLREVLGGVWSVVTEREMM